MIREVGDSAPVAPAEKNGPMPCRRRTGIHQIEVTNSVPNPTSKVARTDSRLRPRKIHRSKQAARACTAASGCERTTREPLRIDHATYFGCLRV